MSKLNVVRRCYTCGAVLQDIDKKKPGYIDPEKLESNSMAMLCNHCADQQKFNISPHEAHIDPDYLTMLKDAKASDAMIVYIVDLFAFESSFISEVSDILSGLNILVIANKRDLLPENYPDEKIKEYVAHRFRVAKLKVKAADVELTSLTSMADVSAIVNRILDQRKRHDVYLVGASNAGKTLFLSSFLRNYSNSTNRAITTAMYPETKMRVMQIPLDSSTTIYDSPGMSIDNSMVEHVDLETLRKIMPTGPIKGKEFNITKGDSLFLGGLCRVDVIKGTKQSVKVYVSDQVDVTKCSKLVDATFVKGLEKGSLKPTSKDIKSLTDFDAFDIDVDEVGDRDIGIEGLGWFSFIGNQQIFRIFVPKGVAIYTTRSKIQNNYENKK